MDQQVETNVKASNIYANTLKLRNQLALIVGTERASIISTTYCKLDKQQREEFIKYLQSST